MARPKFSKANFTKYKRTPKLQKEGEYNESINFDICILVFLFSFEAALSLTKSLLKQELKTLEPIFNYQYLEQIDI
jgi:hypothetical protein